MQKVVVSIVVVVAIALVVCLVPLKEVPYVVTVNYEDTETYYEDEPYEETETYTETFPLEYEVVKSEAYTEGGIPVASIVVRNEDNLAGIFTVQLYFICSCTIIEPGSIYIGDKVWSQDEELYLEPNEAGTAIYRANDADVENCDCSSWNYGVTPDTKEVDKERTVTKYRQVQKERTVTKQREETRYKKITLLDYWLHY